MPIAIVKAMRETKCDMDELVERTDERIRDAVTARAQDLPLYAPISEVLRWDDLLYSLRAMHSEVKKTRFALATILHFEEERRVRTEENENETIQP